MTICRLWKTFWKSRTISEGIFIVMDKEWAGRRWKLYRGEKKTELSISQSESGGSDRRLHIKSDDRSKYWEGGENIAGEYGAEKNMEYWN